MLEGKHQQRSSSSSRAWICPIEWFAYTGVLISSSTEMRSAPHGSPRVVRIAGLGPREVGLLAQGAGGELGKQDRQQGWLGYGRKRTMFRSVNGVQLHTVMFGDGPRTLVATGGWTGSWELWQQPFELLTAAGWRCISFDHRGSGESPVDPDLITVEAMTEDVIGVLDAYGVGQCVLAGESMGGAIAQLAVEHYPNRFTGLVLVDPAEAVFNDRRAMLAAGSRADYPATVQAFIERCVPEPDSEHVKRWGHDILLRAEPEQAARLLEMWQHATASDPSRITVPTLIVHGAADAIVPVEYVRALARLLPDAELVMLDGVGHVPTMTRPHDVVAAICQRFPAVV